LLLFSSWSNSRASVSVACVILLTLLVGALECHMKSSLHILKEQIVRGGCPIGMSCRLEMLSPSSQWSPEARGESFLQVKTTSIRTTGHRFIYGNHRQSGMCHRYTSPNLLSLPAQCRIAPASSHRRVKAAGPALPFHLYHSEMKL
jgi:hypothetical protein